jgi:ribose/xylose/arabinose/galactoside ABC-type transport system permease subunit
MAPARSASALSPLSASSLRTVRPSRFILLGVTILLFVAAALFIPHFFSWGNIANLLQRNSIIGIVARGMLLMIILGGFDLSVGAVRAMTSVAAAYLTIQVSMPVGVVAAIALGLLIGLFNGFCIAKIGISPFVATLGTQVLVTSILFVASPDHHQGER